MPQTPSDRTAIAAVLKTQSQLFSNAEAAAYLGVTERTLEVWRCTKRHRIEYMKVGRLVRYRKAALDRFLESRTIGVE